MNIGLLRIKFIWGAGKVIQARWRFGLFGFYEHAKGYQDSGLVFSLRGLLVLGLCLTTVAYVGGATALFLWLDRGPHNYVTYPDTLFWPLRRDAIREKRGQAYIDEGIDSLKEQRWSEAEMKLRVGLMRLPQALRGRLALAEFYVLSQRRPLALKLLAEGLEVSADYPGRRYLNTYFALCLQGEDYGLVLAAVDRYLGGGGSLAAKERSWLLQQIMLVLLMDKNAALVMEILAHQPADPFFNEQRVMALLALGRTGEAVSFLGDWRTKAGATGQILRLQVRAFREAGQLPEMEGALAELRRQTPTDPAPYAYGIVQRVMAGRRTPEAAGLDDYFLRFGANAHSMLALAQPLAEIGAVELLEHFITRLAEQGHDRRPALLLLAQAHLKNGHWQSATATVARLRALSGAASPGQTAGLELIELLATVAGNPAEGPQVQLLDYVSRQMYPLRGYRMILETLLRAKRHQVALEVAVRAERLYPGNAGLLALKVEGQTALAEELALAAQSTSAGAAKGTVLTEKVFFARTDAAMTAARWPEAQAAVRDVQLAKPAWLGGRQAEVLTRQMRIAHEMRETLDMVLAARLLQDGTVARAQLVVDYASALQGKGATTDAILLLKEVLRKIPNHTLARRLIGAWQKKPEPPPVPAAAPAEPPALTEPVPPGGK
jgi:tetratricopeptide (TPR) repeat protein